MFGIRPGPGPNVGSKRSGSFEIALSVGTTSPYLASRFGTQDLFSCDPTIFIYQIEPALQDVEPVSIQITSLDQRNVSLPVSTLATHAISLSQSAMMARWKPSSQ